ncbi:MAG: CdaR family protein [Anaerolineae bacterium]|nr:CdaR family protein [Candidatus Roseilinea sp.]MDW8448453.1 CdaR family protein [Anaerolineae bacterium]
MARWLANNVSLMILAVLLALFVWGVASLQQDPIEDRTLAAPVVIVAPPASDQTISASTLPPTVTVHIRAPKSTLESLGANGVQVPVDLSQLGVGQHVVKLDPVIRAEPSKLMSSRPLTASVTIEQITEASVPIRVVVEGTPAIGYQAQLPSVEPIQVTITGTQQVVSRVASVDAVINVDGARSSVQQTVRLVARDRGGQAVSNVSIAPGTAVVRVPMEQLSNFKDLAVRVRPTGQPAEGYAITSISASPQVVTVYGPRDAIQQLPGFIDTLEVSVAGATQDVEQRVGLNVPPNVSPIADNVTVLVRVRIEPQQGALTVSRRPIVIGITETLSVKVSPLVVDIVLAGPQPTLNSLTQDSVRVEVDATGLGIGVHQLTPKVIVPEGVAVQSVIPTTVQIEVTDANSSGARGRGGITSRTHSSRRTTHSPAARPAVA